MPPAVRIEVFQLTCPKCGRWLFEWKPGVGGWVRLRCNERGCRHNLKFSFDGSCIAVAIVPLDRFAHASTPRFVWTPLP